MCNMNHVMRNDADDLTTHILSTCKVSIVYSNTATTAMYDPQEQELILPMFPLGKMGRLMLRFHEISHAMETPREWNHQIVATPFRHPKLVDRKITQAAWDFMYKIIAVLEDIRIERAFCKRYRGAFHIMRAGHVELLDMGFYNDPSGEKFDPAVIPTLPLHSRMLLAERLPHLQVRFPDPREAALYDRATRLPDFAAVQDLAVDIFIHTFREPSKQPQAQSPQSKPSKGKDQKQEQAPQSPSAPPMPEDMKDRMEQDEESESQDGDGQGEPKDEKSDGDKDESDADGEQDEESDEKSDSGDEGDDSNEKSDGDKSEGEEGSDGKSSDGLKADEDSESSDSEDAGDDEKSNEGENEGDKESDSDSDALDRAASDEGQDELEDLNKEDLLSQIDENLNKVMAKTAQQRKDAGAVMIETQSRLKKAHKAISVLDVMHGRAQFKRDEYGAVVGVGEADCENTW